MAVLETFDINVPGVVNPGTVSLTLTQGEAVFAIDASEVVLTPGAPDDQGNATTDVSYDLTETLPSTFVAEQPATLTASAYTAGIPPVAMAAVSEDGLVQQASAASSPFTGLVTADLDAVRALAGVSADEWPDPLVQEGPYVGAAILEAQRRIPCDWSTLDTTSAQYLRLALIYQAASLIVPAANPAKTEDFKVGSFTLKTSDTMLLGDAGVLMGWANQYYASVVLPAGTPLPLPPADAFQRPMIRKASVGCRKPFSFLE